MLRGVRGRGAGIWWSEGSWMRGWEGDGGLVCWGAGERRVTIQRRSDKVGTTNRTGVRLGVGNNKKGAAKSNQNQ